MQAIFSLYASANSGKSTTLAMLIDLLSRESRESSIQKLNDVDSMGCFAIGDKTVCVCTAGDNAYEAGRAIDFCKAHCAGVCVFANRTSGGGNDKVWEYAKESGVRVQWLNMPKLGWMDRDLRQCIDGAVAEQLKRRVMAVVNEPAE